MVLVLFGSIGGEGSGGGTSSLTRLDPRVVMECRGKLVILVGSVGW